MSSTNASALNHQVSIYRANPGRTGVYSDTNTLQLNMQLWKHTLEQHDGVQTAPIVADDLVFFGARNNRLNAVDANSGELKWTIESRTNSYIPSIANGILYHGKQDGLYAVDIRTREQKWDFKTDTGKGNLGGSPLIFDGVIYFGSASGYLYAVDADSGRLKWQHKAGDIVSTSPSTYDDVLYFTGSEDVTQYDEVRYRHTIYALDIQSGELLWKFTPPQDDVEPVDVTDPVAYGAMVYLATQSDAYNGPGKVYALDGKTGDEVWTYEPTEELTNPDALAVTEDLVYVAADEPRSRGSISAVIYALDAKNGREIWKFASGDYNTAPIVSNGILYLGNASGEKTSTIYALNAKTGAKLREMALNYIITHVPTLSNGVFYVSGTTYGPIENVVIAIK